MEAAGHTWGGGETSWGDGGGDNAYGAYGGGGGGAAPGGFAPMPSSDTMRNRSPQRQHAGGGGGGGGFAAFDYGDQSGVPSEQPAGMAAASPVGGGAGGLGFDDDEDLPLLEELGIHPEHIKMKAMSVLNPFKIQNTDACREFIEDEDLAGPLCFALMLGFAMMLEGKMHFGHIYAYGVTGSLLVYGLLNLMSDADVGLTFTVSILGYNILPISFLAVISTFGWLLLSSPGFLVYTACAFFITWSAWCSTQVWKTQHKSHPLHGGGGIVRFSPLLR
eukprot:TRINITY_DN2851_c0_g1_i1.p1 TRINITY_DN2851_c0_g1~~TRINITY_DN2851_c0_g1_i1.p1  ORF type:complete len:295 (+),score=95.84 TRINITY_DN2851_c0_g1_i1:60-887(+)